MGVECSEVVSEKIMSGQQERLLGCTLELTASAVARATFSVPCVGVLQRVATCNSS